MGDFRWFLSPADVLSAELVEKHRPDHGLLHQVGRKVLIVCEAPRRTEHVDHRGEIRYLRFAIINGKQPYRAPPRRQQVLLLAQSQGASA